MFVADASVWIDSYAGRRSRETEILRVSLDRGSDVYLCGPALQEVLQGFREEVSFQREWSHLMRFSFLEATRWTFLRAASLYRGLRRRGVTVNSFDTTIVALCHENIVPLLTCDRQGFEPIAKYAGLKLV